MTIWILSIKSKEDFVIKEIEKLISLENIQVLERIETCNGWDYVVESFYHEHINFSSEYVHCYGEWETRYEAIKQWNLLNKSILRCKNNTLMYKFEP